MGPRLVGDERARLAVWAQREVAGDPAETGMVEAPELGRVDLLSARLAAPKAADHAEDDLVRAVHAEQYVLSMALQAGQGHGFSRVLGRGGDARPHGRHQPLRGRACAHQQRAAVLR